MVTCRSSISTRPGRRSRTVPNNDYWDQVDYIVSKANSLGLVIGFLPTWGRYWHDPVKNGKPLFDAKNAEVYGEWLGRRYKDASADLDSRRRSKRRERGAEADDSGDGSGAAQGGRQRAPDHVPSSGGRGSADTFHGEDWLSFNMRQNGHNTDFTGTYENTRKDYDRKPARPVIDGEPLYEDHPISFNAKRNGHSIAADVRRPLYWNLFTGACGHTYGHHSVWQMWSPERRPINDPLLPWYEAIDQPGAGQMQHGRRLIESRPILTRIPDDSIIVDRPRRHGRPRRGSLSVRRHPRQGPDLCDDLRPRRAGRSPST